MWCSTGVTPPEIDMLGMPLGALIFFSFDGAVATTDFTTMPIGSAVSVDSFVCVVFDVLNTQCSTDLATVRPAAGSADYRTKVTVDACRVGEAPTLSVAARGSDWSAEWTLIDENGDETTDYSAMRTASVTVRFKGALGGIDEWTSDTTTCSGVPDPEPSVTPTPSPTP